MIITINFLVKVFAVIFSFVYFLYVIVIFQQVKTISNVFKTEFTPFIIFGSLIQILFGLFFFVFSFKL